MLTTGLLKEKSEVFLENVFDFGAKKKFNLKRGTKRGKFK